MKVWLVSMTDLTCAWTKKEDAINYFKEEATRCGWTYDKLQGNETDDTWMLYCIHYDTFPFREAVTINSIFVDQKPYD